MKKIAIIFCFAISCTNNHTMDKKQVSDYTEPLKYYDRVNKIDLGGFLTSKKSMEYKLSEIFNKAKILYESKYENIDHKKFFLSSKEKIKEYSSFGNAFGGNDSSGRKVKKQIRKDGEYLICQDNENYNIHILFHPYKDYDIGFIYSTDSMNNKNLLPGFILIDKLNFNIYFILASKPRNSSVFVDDKSITKIFILDNNLFPVSSLTYKDGVLLYKTICVYITDSNTVEFETIFLPDTAQNKTKNVKNSSILDVYNYLAYDGIPLGDLGVNLPSFMKEKPLWLMGSFIEYKFNMIR